MHEHPASASSWDLEEIKKLEKEEGVEISVADQCMYGLKTWGPDGRRQATAKKRTKFMTNCVGIARELSKQCNGEHEHQHLVNGRAKWAARYPPGLCRAICKGMLEEVTATKKNVNYLCRVQATDRITETTQGKENRVKTEDNHEKDIEYWNDIKQAWDDVTGAMLDPKRVTEARLEEISYIDGMRVWTKITRAEAERRGWKVIATRWIDVNKGDVYNPVYRSR